MKKQVISYLCLSLLLAASYARADDASTPVSQLAQTIDQAFFQQPLRLSSLPMK